ncbi:pantetheine-phosphate adenylyltransferase [Ilumatobacter nonamiensis]|uniref:pantetheine-phosphate adenylyltransferase n=1 Tax=Ilumatobacter nonamiensis TaxID=467093 RepID=UPI00058CDE06|nr:pantetheine-phosphate adenylyltransferase [Ilumatobacter nonamiensis]
MSDDPTATAPARRVLYPGSFDPLHLGHLDVIEQAHELFGEVVVAVMYNFAKPAGMFEVDERVALIESATDHLGGVTVEKHSRLAVQAAADAGADFVVKGLRTPGDFEIEQQMAQMNQSVTGMRTVFVPCRPDLGFVSSRFVREIANYGGDVSHLVPPVVADALARRVAEDEED